LFLTQSSE